MKPTGNLLVLLEEIGGNPEGIRIMTVNRDVICSYMPETHPPRAKSWKSKGGVMKTIADDLRPKAHLTCPDGKQITRIEFASYGDPLGACGNLVIGNCTAANSQQIVEKVCLFPHLILEDQLMLCYELLTQLVSTNQKRHFN